MSEFANIPVSALAHNDKSESIYEFCCNTLARRITKEGHIFKYSYWSKAFVVIYDFGNRRHKIHLKFCPFCGGALRAIVGNVFLCTLPNDSCLPMKHQLRDVQWYSDLENLFGRPMPIGLNSMNWRRMSYFVLENDIRVEVGETAEGHLWIAVTKNEPKYFFFG